MNNFELRKLLTRSIKVSFPEIRDDVFFEIDRDYKEAYFAGRRCNFFREVDNDVSLNFKIRRYRNRFHISGSIQNTCFTGEVTYGLKNVSFYLAFNYSIIFEINKESGNANAPSTNVTNHPICNTSPVFFHTCFVTELFVNINNM